MASRSAGKHSSRRATHNPLLAGAERHSRKILHPQPPPPLQRRNHIHLGINSTTMKLSVATSAVLFGLSQLASAFAPSTSFAPAARGATTSLNAVSKKDSYTVTLLPGDGIGPEITAATKSVLEALCERCGFQIELKEALIGGSAIDAKNDPFPDESLEQCRSSDSVLLACIGGYKVRCSLGLCCVARGLLQSERRMYIY